MNIKARKMIAIALISGAMVLAGNVSGGSHGASINNKEAQMVNPPAAIQNAPEPYLTEQEITQILESQGYTEIKKLNWRRASMKLRPVTLTVDVLKYMRIPVLAKFSNRSTKSS